MQSTTSDLELVMMHSESMISGIFSHPTVKVIISAICATLATVLGPWTDLYTAALILFLADQGTGSLRALTTFHPVRNANGKQVYDKQGKPLYRSEFDATILGKKTFAKGFIYSLAFIMAYWIGMIAADAEAYTKLGILFQGHRMFSYFVATWIAVTEWESVGKNIRAMGGRFPSLYSIGAAFRKMKSDLDVRPRHEEQAHVGDPPPKKRSKWLKKWLKKK
jgi:hypothetical protein